MDESVWKRPDATGCPGCASGDPEDLSDREVAAAEDVAFAGSAAFQGGDNAGCDVVDMDHRGAAAARQQRAHAEGLKQGSGGDQVVVLRSIHFAGQDDYDLEVSWSMVGEPAFGPTLGPAVGEGARLGFREGALVEYPGRVRSVQSDQGGDVDQAAHSGARRCSDHTPNSVHKLCLQGVRCGVEVGPCGWRREVDRRVALAHPGLQRLRIGQIAGMGRYRQIPKPVRMRRMGTHQDVSREIPFEQLSYNPGADEAGSPGYEHMLSGRHDWQSIARTPAWKAKCLHLRWCRRFCRFFLVMDLCGCEGRRMDIQKDTVALIDYTLYDSDGSVIDQSKEGEPLAYLHGHENLIPGLEKVLEGKTAGTEIEVTVPPEEGYGQYDDNLIQEVPISQFPEGSDPQPGMRFQGQTEAGVCIFKVKAVEGDKVTVDGNHELAGKELKFAVAVREVREAAPEEIEHGHAHGPGGDGH